MSRSFASVRSSHEETRTQRDVMKRLVHVKLLGSLVLLDVVVAKLSAWNQQPNINL